MGRMKVREGMRNGGEGRKKRDGGGVRRAGGDYTRPSNCSTLSLRMASH